MLYRILWFSPKIDHLPSSLISSVTTPHFEPSTRKSILCSSLKIPNHYIPMFLYTWCSLHLECCLFPSVFTCRIILILKDKIQMYFLMKPFMILQIELMYHSIDIYFSVMKTIIASLTQWTQVWANSRRW